jgi:hypothetical protein
VAVAGLAPGWFAKAPAPPALGRSQGPATPVPAPVPVSLRPDSRAVARPDGVT